MTLFDTIVLAILGITWIGLILAPFFMRRFPDVIKCELGTEVIQGIPADLDVDIGNVKLRAKKNGSGFMAGHQTKLLINGEVMKAKSVDIRAAVGEVVQVRVEFYPEVTPTV